MPLRRLLKGIGSTEYRQTVPLRHFETEVDYKDGNDVNHDSYDSTCHVVASPSNL